MVLPVCKVDRSSLRRALSGDNACRNQEELPVPSTTGVSKNDNGPEAAITMTRRRTVALASFVVVFSLLACILVAEWIASRDVRHYSRYLPNPEALRFLDRYLPEMHHLRGIDSRVWKFNERATEFMFSEVRPFGADRSNVLVQGDSWGEQFVEGAPSWEAAKAAAELGGLGVVMSGTTSYSPSPMTIQLRVLRRDFGFEPDVVVALVDQTDIGDELCRYEPRKVFDSSGELVRINPEPYHSAEIFSIVRFSAMAHMLQSDAFSITKLVRKAYGTYQQETLATPQRCTWSAISRPLREGVNAAQKATFLRSLEGYINEVFGGGKVRFLLFVVHPHRDHIQAFAGTQPYRLNIQTLVQEAVDASQFRSKIRLLDFAQQWDTLYGGLTANQIFQEGDPGSHLTEASHARVYAREIFSAITNP